MFGAVHKRRHQSRGRGVAKRWSYFYLFSKSDDEGRRGGQKSQKIDDVFYEWPLFPKQAVDESFDGTLNVLVHNASQIYVPEGDSRHPYEIGQPRDSTYGNLLKSHDEGQKSMWSIHRYMLLARQFLQKLLTVARSPRTGLFTRKMRVLSSLSLSLEYRLHSLK